MNPSLLLSGNESSQSSGQLALNLRERTQKGIVITNEKGEISYVNNVAETILDISFSEVLGEPIDQILALTPLSPAAPITEACPNGQFNPSMFEGLFRLRRGKITSIVSIKISTMGNIQSDGTELVFVIRQIPDYARLTPMVHSAAAPVKIAVCHEPPLNPELSEKPKGPARFSLTYFWLSEIGSTSDPEPQPGVLNDCIEEASRLVAQLTSASGSVYQIGNGESVMFMAETAEDSAIEVTLKLINIVRSRFRLGLSAGILVMASGSSKRDPSLMVETARQLCFEAQAMGDNAIQIYDLNSHWESSSIGRRSIGAKE